MLSDNTLYLKYCFQNSIQAIQIRLLWFNKKKNRHGSRISSYIAKTSVK